MKKIERNHKEKEDMLHLVGWILFVLCAIFFIASSLKNQDTLTFIGSVLFLISCLVFIIPLVRRINNSENEKTKSYNTATVADAKSRAAE
ncbi:hypothetical protein [Desulfobacter latus]|uniref:Cytochrome oxidase subunit III n=1 Tax=Desulfobacter latus TaxID=2292 RepID=A0A850T4C0_9BACT|nr:hypothetical protein [Desulfobacter latus]NWH05931.1 hypothetical protein [Desulfobacter latus]